MPTLSLDALFSEMLRRFPRASDLNFTVGRSPQMEVEGELVDVNTGDLPMTLEAEDTRSIVELFVPQVPNLLDKLTTEGAADCAYELTSGTRLRVNIFRARGSYSIVLRVLAAKVPSLESLSLPTKISEIPPLRNGLVLVTGSTGSGKSTTLAAIVDRMNATRPHHIVTLEDPIEFVHQHRRGTVNQRELGQDFTDFSSGLRSALRQAPKVILVGELRDRETLEIGLKAAETGHLVLSTLHTIDAGQTISRMVGLFESREQPLIRSRIAEVLRYVVSQRLLPSATRGRVAALEIMASSLRVRELILQGEQQDRSFAQVIADARAHGWQTFDQHILELYQGQQITAEVALMHATDKPTVAREIDRMRTAQGHDTSGLGQLEMENQKLR